MPLICWPEVGAAAGELLARSSGSATLLPTLLDRGTGGGDEVHGTATVALAEKRLVLGEAWRSDRGGDGRLAPWGRRGSGAGLLACEEAAGEGELARGEPWEGPDWWVLGREEIPR